MWKYISGVSKVVDEKKNEKDPKAARDTREYEEEGELLGEWKLVRASVLRGSLVRASVLRGSLARMASAVKIKCPTLYTTTWTTWFIVKSTAQEATFDVLKFSLIVKPTGHKQKKSINIVIQVPLFCPLSLAAKLNFDISKVVYSRLKYSPSSRGIWYFEFLVGPIRRATVVVKCPYPQDIHDKNE